MKQARQRYHNCLIQATESFATRIAAGEALATAIDEIVRRYGASDAMAKARAADVTKAIDDATLAIPVPDFMPTIEEFSRRPGSFE